MEKGISKRSFHIQKFNQLSVYIVGKKPCFNPSLQSWQWRDLNLVLQQIMRFNWIWQGLDIPENPNDQGGGERLREIFNSATLTTPKLLPDSDLSEAPALPYFGHQR